jgi:hypothetical protein
MRYMLVRHKVADFIAWKRVFDSHAAAQRKAGLSVKHVLRNMDDRNEVFLFLEMEDVEKAKSFVTSPDVPDAQEVSGVIDRPDLFYLEE